MNILMVASEARPYVKTGGLADVSYSLSKEMAHAKHKVSIIIPLYKKVKETYFSSFTEITNFYVKMNWRNNPCHIYSQVTDGITYYFVDNEDYFCRDGLYGFPDDGERFAFFCLAVKELLSRKIIKPNIVHIHDWHPGMLACLMKEDWDKKLFSKMKIVLSIHNPAFQGLMGPGILSDCYNLSSELYTNGKVRFKDSVSTLKAAIVYADKVLTVSPTHREELLTPEGGMGLDSVLRTREYDFAGFLNGIDYEEFNPSSDKFIAYPYNANTAFRSKTENKRALFKKLNILEYGYPAFSFVSRVTWQKGMDILFPVIDELAGRGCNVVMLGSGEAKYEAEMERLRAKYPKKIAIYRGYNDELAHQIYAGSDFFFMPSLFEPCGLGQMVAQRYGTLPIVRYTGGLKDSVIGYDGSNNETANGLGFYNYSYDELRQQCLLAMDIYEDITLRKKLIRNAMHTDNTWKNSANKYLGVYEELRGK